MSISDLTNQIKSEIKGNKKPEEPTKEKESAPKSEIANVQVAEDVHENEEAKKEEKSEEKKPEEKGENKKSEEKKGLVEKSEEKSNEDKPASEKKEEKKFPSLVDSLDSVIKEKDNMASGMKIESSSLAQSESDKSSGDNLLSSAAAAKEDAKDAAKKGADKKAAKEE